MEKVLSLLTKENITFVFACIGALGTAVNAIIRFRSRMLKFDTKIYDYRHRDNSFQLYLFLYNNSSNSAVISSVYIKLDNDEYRECELLPQRIIQKGGLQHRTPKFPLNISPQEGRLIFLEFLDCKDIEPTPGKNLSLLFRTNHGLKEKLITLPDQSHYLHINAKFLSFQKDSLQ